MKLTRLKYSTLQEAWEGINEYMVKEEELIASNGGGVNGPEIVSYNNLILVDKAWVDPKFDFGKCFGYTNRKWNSLINNYVDFNYLEMIRSEINLRKNRNAKHYNYSFHFSNKHGSGKDCLLCMNFMRHINSPKPVVFFTVRTCEVTRRLIMDLLLLQRIVEFVYGHNEVNIQIYIPSMFLAPESFLMYNNWKPIKERIGKPKKDKPFMNKVLSRLDDFLNVDPKSIKYRVHLRAVRQIQKDKNGWPISGRKPLLAKNLKLLK